MPMSHSGASFGVPPAKERPYCFFMRLTIKCKDLDLDLGKMRLRITNLYGSIAILAGALRLNSEIAIRSSALLPSNLPLNVTLKRKISNPCF
ncbi:hypothetical protein VNO77_03941 [Canavalia gladiata]|uniref:Uncharacterized protein n=1 Tax=Canavalia gladiata TaxID=3824 RepID=A0AAN9MVM2_CANGL